MINTIIDTAYTAWLDENANAFAKLFAADGHFIAPGNRWVGPESIQQAAEGYFDRFEVVSIEVRQVIIAHDGLHAAVEWIWRDRNRATGKINTAEDAIIIEIHQGKIQRWREYIDTEVSQEVSQRDE